MYAVRQIGQSVQMRARVLASIGLSVCALIALVGSALAEEWNQTRDWLLFQEAVAHRDYDAAYQLVLEKVGDEAKAAEQFAWALADGVEIMVMEGHDSSLDWYRRDLMLKVPMSERYRASMSWMRRAATLGSQRAIADFADAYHLGRLGIPHDEDLSTCFRQALSSRDRVADCQGMEQAKGYLDVQLSPAPPVPGTTEDVSQARQAVAAAFARDDLDQAYRIALPYAKSGELDFEYFISGILLYADWAPIDSLSAADRRRLGLTWLRRAAEGNSHAALRELSDSYRVGRIGLPVDGELADCFRAAEKDKTRIASCRDAEVAKGYARER